MWLEEKFSSRGEDCFKVELRLFLDYWEILGGKRGREERREGSRG